MGKLTRQEKDTRWKKLQAEALEHVAKREQFDFPVDYNAIKRIYAMAEKNQRPVGIMIREWVLERLEQEESTTDISISNLNQSKTLNEVLKSIRSLKADLAKITNKNSKRKQKTTKIA